MSRELQHMSPHVSLLNRQPISPRSCRSLAKRWQNSPRQVAVRDLGRAISCAGCAIQCNRKPEICRQSRWTASLRIWIPLPRSREGDRRGPARQSQRHDYCEVAEGPQVRAWAQCVPTVGSGLGYARVRGVGLTSHCSGDRTVQKERMCRPQCTRVRFATCTRGARE